MKRNSHRVKAYANQWCTQKFVKVGAASQTIVKVTLLMGRKLFQTYIPNLHSKQRVNLLRFLERRCMSFFALPSSSFGKVSTPGQTQTGLRPRVYPFTTPDCCTA